jgi:hypothetical protein
MHGNTETNSRVVSAEKKLGTSSWVKYSRQARGEKHSLRGIGHIDVKWSSIRICEKWLEQMLRFLHASVLT